jgi:hypothetical protein
MPHNLAIDTDDIPARLRLIAPLRAGHRERYASP